MPACPIWMLMVSLISLPSWRPLALPLEFRSSYLCAGKKPEDRKGLNHCARNQGVRQGRREEKRPRQRSGVNRNVLQKADSDRWIALHYTRRTESDPEGQKSLGGAVNNYCCDDYCLGPTALEMMIVNSNLSAMLWWQNGSSVGIISWQSCHSFFAATGLNKCKNSTFLWRWIFFPV